MPLDPKASIATDIDEFKTGDTYARTKRKFGRKRAIKQAIAAAYATKRRGHRKKRSSHRG